jgi:hypothetical protein
MASEYEYAAGTRVGDRYRTVAEQHLPGVTADPAWPYVAHRLQQGEAHGIDPDHFLAAADRFGGYADARSTAQVLAFRLDKLLTKITREKDGAPPLVPAWLAPAPPTGLAAPWDTYLPARYTEMDQRISTLVTEAENDRPGWWTRLHDHQTSPGWGEAARQVVAYRTVYGISGDDPLGPMPDQPGRPLPSGAACCSCLLACESNEIDAGALDEGRGALIQALEDVALTVRVPLGTRHSPRELARSPGCRVVPAPPGRRISDPYARPS